MNSKETLKLLLVEDNIDEIKAYKNNIENFSIDNNIGIDIQVEKSLEDALKAISNHFDAAIVDIKLEGDKPGSEPGGQTLINKLLKEFRIPTFVYTGTPAYFEHIENKENILFRKYVKVEVGIKEILNKIKLIFDSGITKIIGRRGLIEKNLDMIFWNHIADNLDEEYLSSDSEKKILRYITAHLHEYLDLDESGNFEKYTPNEVYIHPPINPRVHTGNILKGKNTSEYFIVLTPACDLAQKKAKSIVITPIGNFKTDGIIKQKMNEIKNTKKSIEKEKGGEDVLKKQLTDAENILEKIIGNNYSPKYYFLPFSTCFDGGLIDFQKLITVNQKDLEEKYESKVSVTAPFLKDIIAHFSFYYSRQGAPDLDKEKILRKLTSEDSL
ncbi:MAG: hypothetical protein QG657_5417 [Acidobacteriota bacterium]|nr:hypothetical protein [Acidobacteriota bacterium]